MKHSKLIGRSMLLAVASAAALAMGCADGTKLSAMQEQIHNQVNDIHDRAYRCAPKELALASAHEEFGRFELSTGDGRRGDMAIGLTRQVVAFIDDEQTKSAAA